MSGLFRGGGGDRAGLLLRVTASASGRLPGRRNSLCWLARTDLAGPCEEGRRDGPGPNSAPGSPNLRLRIGPPCAGLESRLAAPATQTSLSRCSGRLMITECFVLSRKPPLCPLGSQSPPPPWRSFSAPVSIFHSFIHWRPSLCLRPCAHGSEGGKPGASLWELPFL